METGEVLDPFEAFLNEEAQLNLPSARQSLILANAVPFAALIVLALMVIQSDKYYKWILVSVCVFVAVIIIVEVFTLYKYRQYRKLIRTFVPKLLPQLDPKKVSVFGRGAVIYTDDDNFTFTCDIRGYVMSGGKKGWSADATGSGSFEHVNGWASSAPHD